MPRLYSRKKPKPKPAHAQDTAAGCRGVCGSGGQWRARGRRAVGRARRHTHCARRGGQVLGDDRHDRDRAEEQGVAQEQLLGRQLHVRLRPRRQRDERLLGRLSVVADVHVLAHPVRDVRLERAGHALPQPVLEHNVLGRLQPDEPLGLALVLRAQLLVRLGDLVVGRVLGHADHAQGGLRLLRRTLVRVLLLPAAAKGRQRHHLRRDDGDLAWLHAPERGRRRMEGEAARRRREDKQQRATERGRRDHSVPQLGSSEATRLGGRYQRTPPARRKSRMRKAGAPKQRQMFLSVRP